MAALAPLASFFSNVLLSSLRASNPSGLMVPPGVLLRALSTSPRSRTRRSNKELWWVAKKKPLAPVSAAKADAVLSSESSVYPRYPEYNRLLPCPQQNQSPRIEHLVVSEGGIVVDYISKALDLPSLFVADLIHFGAVHYALVCPKPPPSATPEQVRLFKEVTEPSVLQKRSSLKGKTVREAQKTYRISHVNEFVEAGTYLRVHVHPKRFPWCYEVDWKSRIIAVAASYVVLDKPAATSVGGTTDNIEESCATFTSRALGLETPLRTTHQIDNCTEGCVVLAKTKEFCAIFHGMIREKQVKKLYLGLTAAPVPLGIISHYMRPVNVAPRLVSKGFIEGWHLCQLEVLECKEVPWPSSDIERRYNIEGCGWPSWSVAYECKINLLTGKTHQITGEGRGLMFTELTSWESVLAEICERRSFDVSHVR